MWPGRILQKIGAPPRGRGHDMVRLGETDTVVPRVVHWSLSGENGHPDLTMTFEIRNGRPECAEIHIVTKPDGRGIRTSDLRTLALDELTETLFSRFAAKVDRTSSDGSWLATGPLWDEGEQSAARKDVYEARRRKRIPVSPAELRKVAEVYQQHEDNAPVKAVQMLLGYESRRTAARRAQQAREAGLLPETTPSKKAG